MGFHDHGDVADNAPLRRGLCDQCGDRLTSGQKRFCSADCRRTWWIVARQRGGALMHALYRWRLYRGRKGTPGEGAIGDVATLVDRFMATDRIEQQKGKKR